MAECLPGSSPTADGSASFDRIPEWYLGGLEDDMRPYLFEHAARGESVALATIVSADSGPRPIGSQMLISSGGCQGFLSGGCIEADVALHGRQVLADGGSRRLVYGRGSPFIDVRLPCGGRLEVQVEQIRPDEPTLQNLQAAWQERRPIRWISDGVERRCTLELGNELHASSQSPAADILFEPRQRVLVIGADAFALAIATAAAALGWEVWLNRPFGPAARPPADLGYLRHSTAAAVAELNPDPWTAIAVATHDLEQDEAALIAALRSRAGYVGVLGARRRLPERLARLRAAGLEEDEIARLRAPIGLPLRAATPREVAISVVGEIIAEKRGLTSFERSHR